MDLGEPVETEEVKPGITVPDHFPETVPEQPPVPA
jgi:hypothetical protein